MKPEPNPIEVRTFANVDRSLPTIIKVGGMPSRFEGTIHTSSAGVSWAEIYWATSHPAEDLRELIEQAEHQLEMLAFGSEDYESEVAEAVASGDFEDMDESDDIPTEEELSRG